MGGGDGHIMAARMKWLIGIGLLLAFLGGLAQAADLLRPPHAQDWRLQTFPGLSPTRYTFLPEGLQVHALRSSALLIKRLEPPQPIRTASWQWRVDQAGPATELTQKGRDDRPLAVHFWFAAEKETGAQGHQHRMPRRSISYTWGGTAAKGAVLTNPFLPRDGVIVILHPAGAALGEWRREQVDLAADYQRIFQSAMPAVSAVAISGDSDDSHSESIGWVRELVLTP